MPQLNSYAQMLVLVIPMNVTEFELYFRKKVTNCECVAALELVSQMYKSNSHLSSLLVRKYLQICLGIPIKYKRDTKCSIFRKVCSLLSVSPNHLSEHDQSFASLFYNLYSHDL